MLEERKDYLITVMKYDQEIAELQREIKILRHQRESEEKRWTQTVAQKDKLIRQLQR